ncbi:hypothetical protein Pint_24847 [Pistacia integerrima]|uniref:Uncharacterized protein n=1 Tax=Pistacia integerrima TaxID=434235 RepID=A0ACC0YAS4_9ROSI|nr:hypothetical protein Pint_24847 [Pistacia integerrima]
MQVVPNQALSNRAPPTSNPTTGLDSGCPVVFGSLGHTFPGIGSNVDDTQAMFKLVVGLLLKEVLPNQMDVATVEATRKKSFDEAMREISRLKKKKKELKE